MVEFCRSALAQCTLLQHPSVVPIAPEVMPSPVSVGAAVATTAQQPRAQALTSYFQLGERSSYSSPGPLAVHTSMTPPPSRDTQITPVNAASMVTTPSSINQSSWSSSANPIPSVCSVQSSGGIGADKTGTDNDSISADVEEVPDLNTIRSGMEMDSLQTSTVFSLNKGTRQQQTVVSEEDEVNTETEESLQDDGGQPSTSKEVGSQPAGSSTLQTGLSDLPTGLSGSGSGVEFIPLQVNDSDSDSDSDIAAELALFVDKPPDRDELFPQEQQEQQQEDMEH